MYMRITIGMHGGWGHGGSVGVRVGTRASAGVLFAQLRMERGVMR